MIYVLCALKCEASPLIKEFSLEKTSLPGNIYTGNGLCLIVTGVGPESVDRLFDAFPFTVDSRTDRFINIGVCGCIDISVSTGTLYIVNELPNAAGGRPQYPDMLVKTCLPEAGCTSFPSPSENNCIATLLADMEAYTIFRRCIKLVTSDRIHIFKCVSDHMDPKGLTKNDISGLLHRNIGHIRTVMDSIMSIPGPPSSPDYSEYYDQYKFTASMRSELSKLNSYHNLRYGVWPGENIYEGHGKPGGKTERTEIFNEIKFRLI